MIDRRTFAALGAVAASALLFGCAEGGDEGSAPAAEASAWTVEAVEEDAYPLDARQVDCWRRLDGGAVLLVLWGSSNPRPKPASAQLDGPVLNVVLEAHDGPATMDLVPSPYVLTPPDGSDGPESVMLDYAGGADPVELPRSEA